MEPAYRTGKSVKPLLYMIILELLWSQLTDQSGTKLQTTSNTSSKKSSSGRSRKLDKNPNNKKTNPRYVKTVNTTLPYYLFCI